MKAETTCIVRMCHARGDHGLPISDDCDLDYPICERHYDLIAAEPGAWKLTVVAAANVDRQRAVVEHA